MYHLEDHHLLYDLQHGFRKAKSCETQLLSLTHDPAQQQDKGIQTYLVIMDFAKSFDKVSHSCLLLTFEVYGMRSNTLQ